MVLSPLLALALLATRVEGGASASVNAQAGSPTVPNDTSIEPGLFVSATLFLDVAEPREGFHLAYSPRFTIGNGAPQQFLHQATIAGNARLSAWQTVHVSEELTLGDQDFSPLAPANLGSATPPPIDRLPPEGVLRVFTSASTLSDTLILTPFMHLALGGTFSIGGGLGPTARAQLPLQRTGAFTSALSWSIDKRDSLAVSLNGSLSAPATAERAETVSATAGWTHTFAGDTTGALQLGAAYLRNEGPDLGGQQPLTPTGSATLTHKRLLTGRAVTFALSTGAAPAIDPLTGAAYLRATLTGSAGYSPLEKLALTVSVSGAHGLGSGLQHDWGAQASLAANIALPQAVNLSFGLRSAWLPPAEAPGDLSGYQWTAFAAIAWGGSHNF